MLQAAPDHLDHPVRKQPAFDQFQQLNRHPPRWGVKLRILIKATPPKVPTPFSWPRVHWVYGATPKQALDEALLYLFNLELHGE